MADHTSPDYYVQVAKESRQKMVEEDASIEAAVEDVVERYKHRLIQALAAEFGRASVRNAQLKRIEDILWAASFAAAEKAKDIMIDNHYKETQASLGNTIEAVFAGIELAKETQP